MPQCFVRRNNQTLEEQHQEMVLALEKPAPEIIASLTHEKMAIWHVGPAAVIEAAELCDAFKKWVMYCKPLDRANVVEELGDLEYYLASIRAHLDITREETLQANIDKLAVRYAKGYSDKAAQERADKMLTNETQKEGN